MDAERRARIAAVVPPGGGVDHTRVDHPRPSRRTERVTTTLVVDVFRLATSHNILEFCARVPARRPELVPGSPSSSGARISNG